MGKLALVLLAGQVLLMMQYPAEGQDITSCDFNPSSCSCETNLGKIDLKQASTGSPYTAASGNDVYYWEPCTDFTLDWFSAGAIQRTDSYLYYVLGYHSQAFTDVKDGYARFNMRGGDGARAIYVTCMCGSRNVFTFENEDPSLSYNFVLTTKLCCLSSGISAGSVMVIIFFSLLVLYLAIGIIFQVAVKKSEGWDRLPNNTLWTTLPGLVRDGFLFTFTCGTHTGYSKV